jgi:hypothetical protein
LLSATVVCRLILHRFRAQHAEIVAELPSPIGLFADKMLLSGGDGRALQHAACAGDAWRSIGRKRFRLLAIRVKVQNVAIRLWDCFAASHVIHQRQFVFSAVRHVDAREPQPYRAAPACPGTSTIPLPEDLCHGSGNLLPNPSSPRQIQLLTEVAGAMPIGVPAPTPESH